MASCIAHEKEEHVSTDPCRYHCPHCAICFGGVYCEYIAHFRRDGRLCFTTCNNVEF